MLGFFSFLQGGRRFSPAIWHMFRAGALIGAGWETGFYFIGPGLSPAPVYAFDIPHPILP